MISKEIVKYSIKSLYKRKTRSLLTIISILVGIATIFIFVSFGLGLYSYINSFVTGTTADKIIIELKGSPLGGNSGFTENDLTAVGRTSGVYGEVGMYMKSAEINSQNLNRYTLLFASDPRKSQIVMESLNLKMDKGRELQPGEIGKAVLGYDYEVDNKIFPKGLSLNQEIEIQGQKVKIIGFLQSVGNPQDDSQIYLTNDFIKKLYPDLTSYYMIIATADTYNISQVADNIDKSLLKSRGLKTGEEDFTVQSFQELLNSYSSALNIVIGFIILIALISVVVSAINTSNTMITSVLERMKEIGIIKSIGARNSEVLNLFLFESSFLGFIAGVLGVLLGFLFTEIMGKILLTLGWGFLQPGYSFWLFAGCIVFATVTGAVSGIVPAIHGSRISPVNALRYE